MYETFSRKKDRENKEPKSMMEKYVFISRI
jgi:hypothetical protein